MGNSLDNMRQRLNGGTQKQRAIENKLWSLQRTIENGDYNSTEFTIDGVEGGAYRGIVNPNKLATGYDEKEISAPFDTGLAAGQIIYCKDLNSYWIVYRQLVVEKAYFRGLMRQCRPGTIKDLRVAVVGPELSRIQSEIKTNLSVDTPNLIIDIWVQDNAASRAVFARYNKFVYRGRTWQVQSFNDIDFEGILIVRAEENYEEIQEEPIIKNDDVKTDDGVYIEGEKIILPLQTQTYKISDKNFLGEWTISENPSLEILNKSEREITIKWNSPKSGSFTLSFGALTQQIIVKSLF